MSDTISLKRDKVKNEVKRIQKLPEYERDRQMKALHKRVIDEIESTVARIDNNQHSMGEKRKESRRLLYCVMVFPKNYRKSIYKIWDKAFGKVLLPKAPDEVSNLEKVKTAHVSGLPLPEQAEVTVWWRENELIFATEATEFSLPAERVMGMGTTTEMSSYYTRANKTHLTIEYKKDNEMKYIVVRAVYMQDISRVIQYFDQIKGARKANRQEL